MQNDFIPFHLPFISEDEEQAVLRVLRSGWLTTGKESLQFENLFKEKVKSTHALAVNSASSGLMLAYDACGVRGKNTAILTTPYTFASTASTARHLGAEVFYADIEENSYSISPLEVEKILERDKKNGKKIKAIVPVHIAGNLCNMEAICALAKNYEIAVIEDAAHAFPSKTKNGYAGTLGDLGVFSFYATKTITCAEGGMVCTNNDEYARRITLMRMHGIDRTVWDRYTSQKASWEYDVLEAGYKCNLPDILAALGIEQLKKAEKLFEMRALLAEKYSQAFGECDFLEIPPNDEGNAWHLYLLRLKLEKLTIDRNKFSSLLQENGIGVSMHFIPHYHFTYWKNYGLKANDFPNTQRQFERTISLPLWPGMSDGMIDKVIDSVITLGKTHGR